MAGFLDLTGLTRFKEKLLAEIDSRLAEWPAVSIVASGEGFVLFSDGRLEQWGTALIANGEAGTRVAFPVSFPNEVQCIKCTPAGDVPVSYSASTDSEAAVIKHTGNGGVTFFYHVIGK